MKFLEPNLVYKGGEARNFLKRRNNGIELLQEYFHDHVSMPEKISRIHVSSLKNPYKEIIWLFTRIVGQDSMETIPRLYVILFVICYHIFAYF